LNDMHDDVDTFRDAQRATWNSVSHAWQRWWPTFEAGAQSLSNRLVEGCAANCGDRVLDVATGIGEPALTAARVVGPTGSVVATDLAPEMLAIAEQRAAAAGLDNVTFVEADAEQLALPGLFDAATVRWGLMLMRDPVAAARSIHRALRPGARLAAAVWGPPSSAPFLALPAAAARATVDLPPADPDAPGPFRLDTPDKLSEVLGAAGFVSIRTEPMTVSMRFADAGAYTAFVRELSTAMRKLLAPQPPESQQRVWQAVRSAAEQHARGGEIVMDNLCWCAFAERG